MKMQKLTAAALAVTMAFGGAAILPQGAFGGDTAITASAATTKLADVNMYIRGSALADDIALPAGNITEYKPPISGTVDMFDVIDGKTDLLKLENGVLKPRTTPWYDHGGFSGTWPAYDGQEPSRIEYATGTATVMLYSGSDSYEVKITVEYYDSVYANKVMDDYIAANITSDMTTKRKVELICAFVASYDYYAGYQSAVNAIASGKGGDCWASVDIVLIMCEKLGIKAWSRNANQDPGAGSGHRNVVVKDGDRYLIADAGYSGKAPRYYSVSELNSLFDTKSNPTGLTVYQYNGGEEEPFSLEIPSYIYDMPVTQLGENLFSHNKYLTSVTIPDTVTAIGKNAFTDTPLLKEIYIPASVQTVERFVDGYDYYKDLEKVITIDPANKWLTAENNVVYNKNKTTLIFGTTARVKTVPSTVTEIADEAFYYNSALTEFTVPGSVKTIGTGAFAFCSNLKRVTIQEGVTSIGAHAFLDSNITVELPDSLTYIDPLAFRYANSGLMGNVYVRCKSTSYAAKAMADLTKALPSENVSKLHVIYTDTLKGDVDGDGKVTAADITLVAAHVKGLKPLSAEQQLKADMDGDNALTTSDITRIAAIVKGIIK